MPHDHTASPPWFGDGSDPCLSANGTLRQVLQGVRRRRCTTRSKLTGRRATPDRLSARLSARLSFHSNPRPTPDAINDRPPCRGSGHLGRVARILVAPAGGFPGGRAGRGDADSRGPDRTASLHAVQSAGHLDGAACQPAAPRRPPGTRRAGGAPMGGAGGGRRHRVRCRAGGRHGALAGRPRPRTSARAAGTGARRGHAGRPLRARPPRRLRPQHAHRDRRNARHLGCVGH